MAKVTLFLEYPKDFSNFFKELSYFIVSHLRWYILSSLIYNIKFNDTSIRITGDWGI